ncbi:MAG: outer membrane beta-barrel protein [Pseudomonadota bacterium]
MTTLPSSKLFLILLAVMGAVPDLKADESVGGHEWSGFYVGGELGFAGSQASEINDFFGDGSEIYRSSIEFNSATGGLFSGYNKRISRNFIISGEVGINLEDKERRTVNWSLNGVLSDVGEDYYSFDYTAIARVRAGSDFGNVFPYISAGAALTGISVGYQADNIVQRGDGYRNLLGLTVGLGAEFAVLEKLRLRAEYNYLHFGEQDIDVNITASSDGLETTVYKVNANRHIGKLGVSIPF